MKKLDWGVIIMFASLFVLMQAVWDTGIVAEVARYLPSMNKGEPASYIPSILISSVLLSQVLSNVPMVTLYFPLMKYFGYEPYDIPAWVALAGGSTLAGNLTLIGAASNLIIVEEAEARGHTLSFFEFFKVGLIVTIVNVLVLYSFLIVFSNLHFIISYV